MLNNTIPTCEHDYEEITTKVIRELRIPEDHLDYLFRSESTVCTHPVQARYLDLDEGVICNVCGRIL